MIAPDGNYFYSPLPLFRVIFGGFGDSALFGSVGSLYFILIIFPENVLRIKALSYRVGTNIKKLYIITGTIDGYRKELLLIFL